MPISRRQFIAVGTATAASVLPSSGIRGFSPRFRSNMESSESYRRMDPDTMRTLAMRGVDAARQAGAMYADIRLTRTISQGFDFQKDAEFGAGVGDRELLGVGIRALVDGYWGFSASPYWDRDEIVQLAHEAVRMAKTNALGRPRVVEWGTIPVVTGSWTMPGIDPFTIPIEEKIDFGHAWRKDVRDTPAPGVFVGVPDGTMEFHRQERYLATTEGTAVLQTTYRTGGQLVIEVRPRANRRAYETGIPIQGINLQGKGWDVFLDANIREQIPLRIAEGTALIEAPLKPLEIGRYDVVFDAHTTGGLIAKTFGIATQLDRAMGYEANAGGTGYLGPDCLDFLGTSQASPKMNLIANRSMPRGLATVKWDDEGVEPDEFALIKDGTLIDYQTTREQAAWLAPWYTKHKMPIRSHGCAGASSAFGFTIQCPPNLELVPATTEISFEDMIASVEKGFAVMGGRSFTDFQAKTGWGSGLVREINKGKLGAIVENPGFLFVTNEFWKNLTMIGGPQSAEQNMNAYAKGQPAQGGYFTVSSVPIAVKQVDIIDLLRRA